LEKLLLRLRGPSTPSAISRVIPIYDAKNAIQNACVKAKLPHFSHHTMRHYFVSNAIEAGIDFKTIAAWVGHKDGGVLVAKTYGHLRDTHSFEMAKRMTFDVSAHKTMSDDGHR
jgi:integrase